jgi:hypothetical protein
MKTYIYYVSMLLATVTVQAHNKTEAINQVAYKVGTRDGLVCIDVRPMGEYHGN